MKKRIVMMMMAALMALPIAAQIYGPSRYNYHGPTRHNHSPRYGYSDYMGDFYFGLRLGLNVSTVNSDDRYLDGGKARTGLGTGAVVGFRIAPVPLYLETGILYMEKGGEGTLDSKKFTYSLNYLEFPLIMKYVIDIDPRFSIQPFFGGFFSAGISGKIKNFNDRQAYSSYDNDAFKRGDAGIRLGCGIQYANLYTEIGYDLGLANISHDYFDTSRTGCFFANIGVNF